MKIQAPKLIFGLVAATLTTAQRGPDPGDIPDFHSDGPFALRVKGQALNSSIEGYVSAAPTGGLLFLQYEAGNAPMADNSSYRFFFNYTGDMKTDDNIELGFFITDPEADDSPPNPYGLRGQALTFQYELRSNVALAVLGAGTAVVLGSDADNKTFLSDGLDDSNWVPNQLPRSGDYSFYNWAVCWQLFNYAYAPALSWVTFGQPHNPTCELVDLIKVPLEDKSSNSTGKY
ncbi:hypothetical protein HD806DRAFT_489552 [Xylariaceae sp. AK1471]|nr:hypothetical protein HD806DRAFT_489552 [Xylariaceae sp. AK1471]